MKNLLAIIALLITVLFSSFRKPTTPVNIYGKVYSANAHNNTLIPGLLVFAVHKGTILATSSVDTDMTYELVLNSDPNYFGPLDVFICNNQRDTLFLKAFPQFKSDDNDADFKIPNSYKMVKGHTVCPKCHKWDKVSAIKYSGTSRSLITPNWRCIRDEIAF